MGSADRDLLWKYLVAYDPGITTDADTEALARALMECAINFYRDFIEPHKRVIVPTAEELKQLRELALWLGAHGDATAEEIEKGIYDLGRAHYDKPGKIFTVIYRALIGQERGPRLGPFIRLATPTKIAELLSSQLG
jgi:lysyl-tRNA synthetase, class I